MMTLRKWLTVLAFAVAAVLLQALNMLSGGVVSVSEAGAGERGEILQSCARADLDRSEALLRPLPDVLYVRGRIEQAARAYEPAREAYDRALETQPDHVAAHTCRESARQKLPCAREIDLPGLVSAWYSGPDQYFTSDEDRYAWARHLVEVKHPMVRDKKKGGLSYLAGREYLIEGRLEPALVLFDISLRHWAENPFALAGRGHVLAAKNDFRDAIVEFDRTIEFLTPIARRLMDRIRPFMSRQLTRSERSDFYMEFMLAIPDVIETLIDAYEARGYAYDNFGDAAKALADYDRALAIMPDHRFVSFLRGRLLARMCGGAGKPGDDAELCFQRDMSGVDALSRQFDGFADFLPRFAVEFQHGPKARSINLQARRYEKRGLQEIVISYALSAVQPESEARLLPYVLPALYAAEGDYDNALKEYAALIAAYPDAGHYRADRAAIHLAQERFDLAIEDLNAAVDMEDDFVEAHYLRALSFAGAGLHEQAIADLEHYIGRGIQSNAHAWFYLARSRVMTGEYMAAIQDLSKAVDLATRFARAYELRALSYLALMTDGTDHSTDMDGWSGCVPQQD